MYILKDLYVHVNVVISIHMYGNAQGEAINKTCDQVKDALPYTVFDVNF